MKVLILFISFIAISCGGDGNHAGPPPTPKPVAELSFLTDVAPLFERSCSPCHFGAEPTKGLSLDSQVAVTQNAQKALAKIQAGEMPPANSGKTPISVTEQTLIVNWFNAGAK
jgi:uncharacterized membrane protein